MGGGKDGRLKEQATLFYRFSLNNSFSMKKKIKNTLKLPKLFSNFHVLTNFHYKWTNNEEKNWD